MTATIEIRNNYGNEAIYPVNETAKTLADIAGTKTLSRSTIKKAKTLGFEFKVIHPSL